MEQHNLSLTTFAKHKLCNPVSKIFGSSFSERR